VEPLYDGPLEDYVPAAGLRWLVLARPAELASHPKLREQIERLVPESRLQRFASSSGVDLSTLPTALVAGFDLGVLYMGESPGELGAIELAFEERLLAGTERQQPHQRLTRISGVVGRTPQSLLLLDDKRFAVAVGDTTLTKIVEAFARRKLTKSPTALHGVALRSFANFDSRAPLRMLAPGPFEDRWMLAAEGLLAAADGIALSMTPRRSGRVAVAVAIDGPWANAGDDLAPAERLRLAWEALATSSTGRLFGLDAPASLPTIEQSDSRVSMRVELELAPLVAGLRAAVAADVWEMLDLTPNDAPGEPPAPTP
jgi:hypothetical protein